MKTQRSYLSFVKTMFTQFKRAAGGGSIEILYTSVSSVFVCLEYADKISLAGL